MRVQTENVRIVGENGFWNVTSKISSDEAFFPIGVKGLSSALLYCKERLGVGRDPISGTLQLEVSGTEERGRYTCTLTIESDAIVVVESPDWSTGQIFSRFPKTIDSLAYALTFLQ